MNVDFANVIFRSVLAITIIRSYNIISQGGNGGQAFSVQIGRCGFQMTSGMSFQGSASSLGITVFDSLKILLSIESISDVTCRK